MMSASVQRLKVYDQNELPPKAPEGREASVNEWNGLWKTAAISLGLMIFLGAGTMGFNHFKTWLDRPIEQIEIEGDTRYINRQEIAEKLAAGIQADVLSLDIRAVHDRLLEEPWVHGAEISRVWPPALKVVIDEQRPVARWGDKGLLNHQGDVFWPGDEQDYTFLPLLQGPASATQQLMAQYHDLSLLFKGAEVNMVELTLETRGAWRLRLNNGIEVILGREQIKERLNRFLHVYQTQLADRADQIEKIDIRYNNGVAVQWRAQEEENAKAG
jgi:cell division protein FtsQ